MDGIKPFRFASILHHTPPPLSPSPLPQTSSQLSAFRRGNSFIGPWRRVPVAALTAYFSSFDLCMVVAIHDQYLPHDI
jgi:hypothetical protein